MKWLFTALIAATACGGTSAQGGDSDPGNGAVSPFCSEEPSEQDGGLRRYQAGDPIMSVEAIALPITEIEQSGDYVIAGQFLFQNYWNVMNGATRVCIRNVGTGALEHVESLWFDVINGALEPASTTGQEITGVICLDRSFTIGAGGNKTLVVGIRVLPGAVPGATYQFEITSPGDVTLGDPSEEIGGAFPIKGSPLTVIPNRYQ